MPLCKSCQAPIFWLRTVTGKRIPVDPEPVDNGNIVLRDGYAEVVPPTTGVKAYVSHFVTCPQAKTWRKGK